MSIGDGGRCEGEERGGLQKIIRKLVAMVDMLIIFIELVVSLIKLCPLNISSSLYVSHTSSAAAAAKSLQSCPTLCDPIDGSPPGSPVPGILQARTLEWVTISFSSA